MILVYILLNPYIFLDNMNLKELKPYLIESFLYVLEIIIVLVIINCIFTCFFPIKDFFDFFSRCLGIYTIYQIFIYSTLKLANDAQKDAYSTLKSMNEYALLLIEVYGNDYAKYFILSIILKNHINLQLDKSVFNMEDVREKYRKLIVNIDNKDIFSIKFEIISINHELSLLDQEFLLSIILRLIRTSTPTHVNQYMHRFNENNIKCENNNLSKLNDELD